jgi:hypothetical protein
MNPLSISNRKTAYGHDCADCLPSRGPTACIDHFGRATGFSRSKGVPIKLLFKLVVACCIEFWGAVTWASYSSGMEKFNAGKYAAAAKDFEAAATEGSPYAKFMYGKLLISGQGVPKDTKRGLELITDVLTGLDNEAKKLRADLRAQTVELNALKGERERDTVARSRVGQQVCRVGTLRYSYQPMACTGGQCVYANQVLQDSTPDGRVTATVESTSSDGSRIQLRVTGWFSQRNWPGIPILRR